MRFSITTVFTALFCALVPVHAQETVSGEIPSGTLAYSLPSTSITIEAEAVREQFFAGPYARYAEKYLGISVMQSDMVKYTLSEVRLSTCTEADQGRRFLFNAGGKQADAALLKLTSQGLVSMSDMPCGQDAGWRFPAEVRSDFAGKGITSNLTSGSTTLYRNSKEGAAFSKVAVKQDMVVEKSLEKRAAEAASLIFELRKKRLQIVTGDTDATYSGEAMGAAVAEITRLEQEYMMMFTGYSEYQTQSKTFELVPQKDRDSQLYVAFRLSDTEGLLLPDNLSGKPVIMEIVPEALAEVPLDKKDAKGSKAPSLVYRVPAACTVRLLDGMNVVMQTRMLIYQLGNESSLPVNIAVK